jgi:mRNA interferase MazF
VLLSRDAAYRVRAAITVAPITRTIRNIPVEVALDRSDGMPAHCVVNLDDITTLPKVLIKQRITVLSAEKIHQIDDAIRLLRVTSAAQALSARSKPKRGPVSC